MTQFLRIVVYISFFDLGQFIVHMCICMCVRVRVCAIVRLPTTTVVTPRTTRSGWTSK